MKQRAHLSAQSLNPALAVLTIVTIGIAISVAGLRTVHAGAATRYVTVEADGIGDTPQSAVRNAAENGLKRVLGSYMDAETIILEKSRVQNGQRSQSEEVRTRIREYSRGMIKDVERLSVTFKAGVYHALVRVTIKVDK